MSTLKFFPERGGFEPPVVSQLRRFSKPMHSTALPPFLFWNEEKNSFFVATLWRKRVTRFERATCTLARCRSTTELYPQIFLLFWYWVILNLNQQLSFFRKKRETFIKRFFSVSEKYSIVLALVQLILWVPKILLNWKKIYYSKFERVDKNYPI